MIGKQHDDNDSRSRLKFLDILRHSCVSLSISGRSAADTCFRAGFFHLAMVFVMNTARTSAPTQSTTGWTEMRSHTEWRTTGVNNEHQQKTRHRMK
jgi:hypothetical protein